MLHRTPGQHWISRENLVTYNENCLEVMVSRMVSLLLLAGAKPTSFSNGNSEPGGNTSVSLDRVFAPSASVPVLTAVTLMTGGRQVRNFYRRTAGRPALTT